MEIRTYRARTMQDALALVREELGPEAAVLHTREIRGGGLWRWMPSMRQVEVTASTEVNVPSRLGGDEPFALAAPALPPLAVPAENGPRDEPGQQWREQLQDLQSMVTQLCQQSKVSGRTEVPPELFHLYTDLIEAEISEELARGLVERVRQETPPEELHDVEMVKSRLSRLIEADISVCGPLQVRAGRRKVVALVGPTGVGKTTTIAKLAAHYRLREKRKVGLITVDTYRIAAVEQLRTYADIIDLPMQVISTPREMREAVARMADLDLVLMDTAGRSPRDEVKLHELKSFLSEAAADEVHLVLSSVAGAETLQRTAIRFATVGATALILTKLDEATGLGNLLPLLRTSQLPLSYLTNGQNVPDDIAAAEPRRLTQMMLEVNDDRRF